MKIPVALFLASLPALAQIQRPQLGYMLDSGGALRRVFGIAASAILGDAVGDRALAGVSSFACASTLCLAKTDAAVVAFVPSTPSNAQGIGVPSPIPTPCACPGPALIALDPAALDPGTSGGGAWIYFRESRQFARWQDGVLKVLEFSPGGEMLSLRATTDGFDYAVTRESSGRRPVGREAGRGIMAHTREIVWIEHYSASSGGVVVLDSVVLNAAIRDSPNTPGAVLLLDNGILLSSDDQLTLRRPNGQELAFPLDGANSFQAAGNGYVEIVASGGMWILRTDPGSEQLSLLPGAVTPTPPGALPRAALPRAALP